MPLAALSGSPLALPQQKNSEALPRLANGTDKTHVGTYVAEERTKEVFELMSADKRPRKFAGEKKKRYRYESVMSPWLPPIAPIEPLLGENAHKDRPATVSEQEDFATDSPRNDDWGELERRLYPGRVCDTKPGGTIVHTAPRTVEFGNWLSDPRASPLTVGFRRPNRTTGVRLRPVSTVPEEAHASSGCADGPSESNLPSFGEAEPLSPVSPLSPRGGGDWHIVLLQSTYKEPANTAEHVMRVLSHVLGGGLDSARKKAMAAMNRRTVKILSVPDSKNAFEKAESMRAYGLNVQVVSEQGLPEGGKSRQTDSTSYNDVFKNAFHGRAEHISPRVPHEVLPKSRALRRFQHAGTEKDLEKLVDLTPNFNAKEHFANMVGKQMNVNNISAVRKNLTEDTQEKQNNPKTLSSVGTVAMVALERVKGESVMGAEMSQRQSLSEARRASLMGDGMTTAKKEACQMLRFFVYGQIGNEFAKTPKEKEAIFQESMGSLEEVIALFNLWTRLDDDGSGRADIFEFRQFAEKQMRNRLQEVMEEQKNEDNALLGTPKPELAMLGGTFTPEEALKFTTKLCDRLGSLLLGKKSSFTVEDMMKIIWPACTVNDVKEMFNMFSRFKRNDRNRIKTPPVLPTADLEALIAVFQNFDSDNSGTIGMEELKEQGLLYEDQMSDLVAQWDRNGDGQLDMWEFAEMMCPAGYRAHPKAKVACKEDGAWVIFDGKLDCWRVKGEGVVTASGGEFIEVS